jgi:uncharacterized protein YraI
MIKVKEAGQYMMCLGGVGWV